MKALFKDIATAVSMVADRASERKEEAKHQKALDRLRRKVELEEYEKKLRAELASK